MRTRKMIYFYCVLVFFIGLVGWSFYAAAEDKPQIDLGQKLNEMPVLTGDLWQKMTVDEKVAFVWGIGHVVSIERQTIERYPELKRESFVSKLAEGLAGMPMNGIIIEIDKYYRENPDDLEAPVMEVMWDDIVKPKLKSGIANVPLN